MRIAEGIEPGYVPTPTDDRDDRDDRGLGDQGITSVPIDTTAATTAAKTAIPIAKTEIIVRTGQQ